MLSRIRNTMLVNKSELELPHSKLKESVAKILADYGFISAVEADGKAPFKTMKITVHAENEPVRITKISRVSRPGRRVYVKAAEIPTVKRGRGIAIISTSKGVMASPEAKSKGLGGELICEVY